jgi:LIM homeobox protein 3/4
MYTVVHKNIESHFKISDLSNDSYSTINMGLEDGTSPHSGRGSYLHGSGSPPPYLSSRSPPPMGQGHNYSSYSDNIVYTSLGKFLLIFHRIRLMTFIFRS